MYDQDWMAQHDNGDEADLDEFARDAAAELGTDDVPRVRSILKAFFSNGDMAALCVADPSGVTADLYTALVKRGILSFVDDDGTVLRFDLN
jgi:hypothetical protein